MSIKIKKEWYLKKIKVRIKVKATVKIKIKIEIKIEIKLKRKNKKKKIGREIKLINLPFSTSVGADNADPWTHI